MRYSKKHVLVLVMVFITWCIIYFISLRILPLIPLKYGMVVDIIGFLILPGILIMVLLWDISIMANSQIYMLWGIFFGAVIYIGSPGFYVLLAHLIMRRMERNALNSKTNNGGITTLFGPNDKL